MYIMLDVFHTDKSQHPVSIDTVLTKWIYQDYTSMCQDFELTIRI